MRIKELYRNLDCSRSFSTVQYSRDGSLRLVEKHVVIENLLDVYVNEKLRLKIVCTPSDLAAMVVGHLYTEGMIPNIDCVELIYVCESGHRARVFIDKEHADAAFNVEPLEIRTCNCSRNGMLGRKDMFARENAGEGDGLEIIPPHFWDKEWIFALADAFAEDAPIHAATRGTHSCYLMNKGEIKYTCEDIGRHNALDKVIGRALIEGVDLTGSVVFSSGRIPLDMLQKIIRSRVPVIASNSIPTDQVVELAQKYNVTLVCSVKRDRMDVFSDGSQGLRK